MSNAFMALFTGVIATATLVEAVVTVLLWRATRRSADAAKASADAAKISADAAKKSADIDAALHQPYLGVSLFKRDNDYNLELWAIRCGVKNYGTLPARDVRVEVVVDRDGQGDFGRGSVCIGWELLPNAELEGFVRVRVDRDAHDQLWRGETSMAGHVRASYVGPEGKGFVLRAKFAYDRTTQNFKADASETVEGGA